MKQLFAPAFFAGITAIIFFAFPAHSYGSDYSASIRATATVLEPVGLTNSAERPDVRLLAPRFSSAFVVFAGGDTTLITTLKADDNGIGATDFLDTDFFNAVSLVNATLPVQSILTIIPTEN